MGIILYSAEWAKSCDTGTFGFIARRFVQCTRQCTVYTWSVFIVVCGSMYTPVYNVHSSAQCSSVQYIHSNLQYTMYTPGYNVHTMYTGQYNVYIMRLCGKG